MFTGLAQLTDMYISYSTYIITYTDIQNDLQYSDSDNSSI